MTQQQPDGTPEGAPQDAAPHPGPGPAADDTSGVDDFMEEQAPSEPSDTAAVDDPASDPGPDAGSDPGSDPVRQLAERTADLQRLQAEYLNYKRRVDRDRELVRQNATFTVLNSLLPVLDDIDRAKEHGEVEGGFKAVADSLDRVVSGLGLSRFGTPGEPFDPNRHEALAHGHSAEVSTTSVEHVAQAGYLIGERVVRPARVTVLDPE